MQHRLFNAHEKKTVLSLGFGLLIVMLLLCSCGSTGTSSTVSPTPTKQSTQTTPTTVLGGPLKAFVAKYGQPNNHSGDGNPRFERCKNADVDQVALSQVSLESRSGPIMSILINSCPSTPWSVSQASAVCSAFLPSDAKYQRSVQVPGNSDQSPSVDKIYFSATLAHTFAADNFTDNNGALVQPGLLDVNYFYASNSDTSHMNSCDLELGDSQTSPD
jgi:hypothetical protein